MKKSFLPLALLLLTSACSVPVGPVEVSRFSLPDSAPEIARLGHGTIAVAPGTGMESGSLELQSFEIAVEQELARIGYQAAPYDRAEQIAQVRFARADAGETRPVSIMGGGSAGSYGSSAGVGFAIPLGSSRRTITDLIVVIRDRASGKVLWEGRSSFTVSATSPLAKTALAAPKLAGALFSGFPGKSGETVMVP